MATKPSANLQKALTRVAGRHDNVPSVQKRALLGIARKTTRGVAASLYETDRKLANAMKAAADELLAELQQPKATPSARALAETIVLARMRRDMVAAIVIKLGPYVVNKKKRGAYPIVAELNQLDRLLADLLKQWNELVFDTDLLKRIEALEEGRTIDATP